MSSSLYNKYNETIELSLNQLPTTSSKVRGLRMRPVGQRSTSRLQGIRAAVVLWLTWDPCANSVLWVDWLPASPALLKWRPRNVWLQCRHSLQRGWGVSAEQAVLKMLWCLTSWLQRGYKYAIGSWGWKILPDMSMVFLTDAEKKALQISLRPVKSWWISQWSSSVESPHS